VNKKQKIEPRTQSKSLCINQRETNKIRKPFGQNRRDGTLSPAGSTPIASRMPIHEYVSSLKKCLHF